jgi:hypothetical protein
MGVVPAGQLPVPALFILQSGEVLGDLPPLFDGLHAPANLDALPVQGFYMNLSLSRPGADFPTIVHAVVTDIARIPEPPALAVLLVGLAGLVGLRWRGMRLTQS